jgi:hypothetical protein
MSNNSVKALVACQEEVERRMRIGEPFGSVEDMINGAEISEDEKAALWLLAWSLRDRKAQLRENRSMLATLATR